MRRAILLVFIQVILLVLGINAQDKMIMRMRGDTLLVKVTEIGTEVIKYKQWPIDTLMPVFSQPRDRVLKIIFPNGQEYKFSESEFLNAENYRGQRKFALKFSPFDLVADQLVLSAEQSVKPGRSRELSVNIIGAGVNSYEEYSKASGLAVGYGIKFINTPDYYLRGMRYSHLLKGGYIKPELLFTYYNASISDYYYVPGTFGTSGTYTPYDIKSSVLGYGLFLNFGKQWVFSNAICLDVFFAPGIGRKIFTNLTEEPKVPNASYQSYILDSETLTLGFVAIDVERINYVFNYGLRIGLLTNGKIPKRKK